MEKIKPQIIKIKAKIITPIHISNNEVFDRIDYITGEEWNDIQILNREWLKFCAIKNKQLFYKIIKSIKKGYWKDLENYKQEFYEEFMEEFIEYNNNAIICDIKINNKAKEHLLMTGNKQNNGEIKQFAKYGIDKKNIIPGSTLKGLFRSIFLFNELKYHKYNGLYNTNSLSKENTSNKIKKIFSNILFKDITIENPSIIIEQIFSKNSTSNNKKAGIPQIIENISEGEFTIEIVDLKGILTIDKLKKMISNYSGIIMAREEQIINNIDEKNSIIDTLDNYYNKNIPPIKIGMYKKSGTYKPFWEEELKDIGKTATDGKKWQELSRRYGIGDKSMFINEEDKPLGWIGIDISNIIVENYNS